MGYDDDEDDDFDYDDFVAREFGQGTPQPPVARHWYWVAVSLLILFALSFLMTLGSWTPF